MTEAVCSFLIANAIGPGTYRTDALTAHAAAGVIPPRIPPCASGYPDRFVV